jgi:hypothetical protein
MNEWDFRFTNMKVVRMIKLGHEIVDGSAFVSVKSCFKKSWIEGYD